MVKKVVSIVLALLFVVGTQVPHANAVSAPEPITVSCDEITVKEFDANFHPSEVQVALTKLSDPEVTELKNKIMANCANKLLGTEIQQITAFHVELVGGEMFDGAPRAQVSLHWNVPQSFDLSKPLQFGVYNYRELIPGVAAEGEFEMSGFAFDAEEDFSLDIFLSTNIIFLLQTNAPSEADSSITVENEGVTVNAADQVFPANTAVTIEKLTQGTAYQLANTALAAIASEMTVYDITAQNGGAAIQPNGNFTVSFTVPQDYDFDTTAIYYVKEDGTYERLQGAKNETLRTITVTLDHLSIYAVVEQTESPATGDRFPTELLICVALLSILAVAVLRKERRYCM